MTVQLLSDALPTHRTTERLTTRERVVLSHLSEHMTLEDLASQLWVTRNTVKTQVRSLYRKLGVSTRAEAIALAGRYDLWSTEWRGPGRSS